MTSYTHDEAGQLTAADHALQADEAYAYDANGNRATAGIVTGPNNQLVADGTFTFTYDHEGNLASKTETATGIVATFAYDHRNRLISVVERTAGGLIVKESNYTYDVFDRRIAKTVDADGAGPIAPQASRFVYDGLHVWADFDANGSVTARYLYGDNLDELLARFQPAEGTAWHLTDHLGTVRDLADSAGNVINHLEYDSFGRLISQTNAAAGDRYTYTGREFDGETGLYYYRSRYYDPASGRFISPDPIGFAARDPNLYRYVANSPLSATDPLGLMAVSESAPVGQSSAKATKEAGPLGIFMRCVFQETGEGIVFQLIVGAGVPGVGVADITESVVGCAFTGGAGAPGGGRSIDDFLRAGQRADRNGLTKAGRALQKHGDRSASAFPKSMGNPAARNAQGQQILEGILNSGQKSTRANRFGGQDIFDAITGRGARFDGNGNFIGFLEP
jgi:RHS repeat-associated protein